MKAFVVLTGHFLKDEVIIWFGAIFCDAESMDTQYKIIYSSYYCVKIQEEKFI